MTTSFVADMVNLLDANLREDYEERAAIMQFDGGLPREHAECLALLNVIRRYPMAMSGLSILKAELDGETRFIVTTNALAANQHLSTLGYVMTVPTDLASVVDSEFDGMALLASLI
jgi:hypothetical protein